MSHPDPVPLLDLGPQHRALRDALHEAVLGIIDSQRFVLGEHGRGLEAELAAYVGAAHGVGCASGSDALALALRAFDLGPGDAIVTTPQSFFATAGAAARLGIRVDFCDVEPDTLNLDPESLRAFLAGCTRDADGTLREPRAGQRLRAVIAVDLFGRPCRYDAIEALCAESGLELIEDAAQSVGAAVGERRCGTFGRLACFSFYPTKNLGGAGDGGLITTNDEALAQRLSRLRVHGQSAGRYIHGEVGWNSRLDELQAAVLRVKLPHLDAWNEARRAHARAYNAAFAEVPGIEPLAPPDEGVVPVYHLYVVRAERRDALREHLSEAGIGSGVYYPLPLHLQECFASMGYQRGDLPRAEAASGEVLALPMYPELPEEARARVIAAVQSFFAQ